MKISQNKENVFTKGLSKTDVDVLSMVKRFFEQRPEELKGTIDGIVSSVLRQVKIDLIEGNLAVSVTSVNGETGQVIITPDSIGAEPSIEKKTAFNKDFGSQPNTVCEGNDPRLSDAREPMEHKHEEYIKTTEINTYIKKYLTSIGIDVDRDSVMINNKDLVVSNGKISEV